VGAVLLMKLARLVDREQVLLLGAGEPRVEDDVFLEVEDLLQLAQGHVQELSDATREPLEEPDVRDRRGQLDVPHPLAPHASTGHLDAAFVAHDTRELHALVLAAGALVVLRRAEDPRAEQAVALGLERSVVDGLGLLHLTVRPVTDLLGRGELDPDRVKRDALRMPIEDAPQILRWLVLSDQAAERPIRQHSVFSSQEAFLPSSMISSTSTARLWSSFTSTLKACGVPGWWKRLPVRASYGTVGPEVGRLAGGRCSVLAAAGARAETGLVAHRAGAGAAGAACVARIAPTFIRRGRPSRFSTISADVPSGR